MIFIESILHSSFNPSQYNFDNTYIVMIDVLRASSVIITALNNGANSFIPVASIDESLKMKDENKDYLLAGERNSYNIDGFDLGNSPLEYTSEIIKNKNIIFSSSNGSKIFTAGTSAYKRVIASFINSEIVLNDIFSYIESDNFTKKEINIFFVCAGTNGKYSREDGVFAGKLISEINQKHKEIKLSDSSELLKTNYLSNKDNLFSYLNNSKHALYLKEIGLSEDIVYCFSDLKIKTLPIVFKDNVIR